jgi:NADH pyrophosphatase NudC (nudix superfamily)
VHWDNPLPVVAGLVELEGRVLLARNRAWASGMFGLITGFLERDETPQAAIAREVREETALQAHSVTLIGVYEFMRAHEVLMAYHVVASGTLALSEELVDVRLVEPARLRPWPMGTGYAVADWMRARGLPFEFIELPARQPAAATERVGTT